MKARYAFLGAMGIGAALITGELFFSMQENSADAQVRKLNGVGDDEPWFIAGSLFDPAASRAMYQGPNADAGKFLQADADLGFRLQPNLRALPGRLRQGGKTIYDISYSTNRFGWRATPVVPEARADIFFFGDSFTFGQGLADNETLPARFETEMKGSVMAHNLGVPGWGAQQTLRLLELSQEKPELMMGRVTKAYYFVTRSQLARLSGESLESAGSPRYEIRHGEPVFSGNFSRFPLSRLCGYSSLCNGVRPARSPPGAAPADLAAVLGRIQGILKERYQIRLTVICWNDGTPEMDRLEKEVVARGLDLLPLRAALPGKLEDYVIPFDGHPSAEATKLLGKYLAERLER